VTECCRIKEIIADILSYLPAIDMRGKENIIFT